MGSRLARWVFAVTLILSLLIGTSRTLGTSQPPAPESWTQILAKDSTLQKAQGVQCWRGICPGSTTIGGIMSRLDENAYQTFPSGNVFEVVTFNTPLDSWLNIRGKPYSFTTRYLMFHPRELYVGEALAYFGLPNLVYTIWNGPLRSYEVHLCFAYEVCVFTTTNQRGQLLIWSKVAVVYYERGELDRLEIDRFFYRDRWRGFAAYGLLPR